METRFGFFSDELSYPYKVTKGVTIKSRVFPFLRNYRFSMIKITYVQILILIRTPCKILRIPWDLLFFGWL